MIYEISGAGHTATMESTGAYSNVYEHWKRGHWYEQPLLEYWRTIPVPDVVIDVGAHAGNHTVWAGLEWPHANIHSIEPNPVPFKVLGLNCIRNDVHAERWSTAISDKYQRLTLVLGREDEGMAQLSVLDESEVHIPVAAIPLDGGEFIGMKGWDILLKIDAESDNEPILRGAARLLRDNDCHIFIECATDADKAATGAVLQEYGYRFTGKVFGATPMYEAIKGDKT